MLFMIKKTYKLDDVVFNIPKNQEDYQYLESWEIKSKDDSINLTFNPIYDRNSYTNAFIIKSDQHQVFGHFSGF